MSILREERMKEVIVNRFHPDIIEITDESALHAHHHPVQSGLIPSGETHYRILIVSPHFEGVNRVQRSRMIHELLDPEFSKGLHALALILRTPSEHSKITNS